MTFLANSAEPYAWVGGAAVVDVESAYELFGRGTLPHPLGRSRPVGSVWLATRGGRAIDERMADGDLIGVRTWVEALLAADVCVECRVRFSDESLPDLRVHGLQTPDNAYVAVQTRDADGVDIVDAYELSYGTLGAVVADMAGLVGAGRHARIVLTDRADESDLDFLGSPGDLAAPGIDRRDVAATGTVQVRRDQAELWGVDPALPVLHWIRVHGDGDYLFEPGSAEYAEPVDPDTWTSYLHGMIADISRR